MSDSDSDSDLGFTSFSTAPAAVTNHAAEIVKHKPDKHRKRKSNKDSDGDRHKPKRRDKEKDRSRHRQTKKEENRPKRRLLENADAWDYLASQGIATMDRRGNNDLKLFDGATRSGTPKFIRKGGRRVVGLKDRILKDTKDADELMVVLEKPKQQQNRIQRYSEVDWWQQMDGDRETVKPGAPVVALDGESEGFVPLTEDTDELAFAGPGVYDSDEDISGRRKPDYKSMDGDAGRRAVNAARLRAETGNPQEEYLCGQRVAEYEQRLADDSSDIDAWMSLVSVQEEIIRASFGVCAQHKIRRSVAETRMEIYRRALASNPQNTQLALGYLDQCCELMNDDELLNEWQTMLDTFGSQPLLVMQHIRMCQGMGTKFSVSGMADIYAADIRRIVKIMCGESLDHARRVELSAMVLDLIHGVCLMFREAGFAERALAVYQAFVEWYLLVPERLLSAPASHRIHSFETFWDSGVPRIGSDGARGWCAYADTTDYLDAGSNIKDNGASEDLWFGDPNLWCEAEKQASLAKTADMPISVAIHDLSDSVIDSTDPFAVSVFEDVEPFLVDIPWDPVVARALMDRFMQFLGIVGPRMFVFAPDLVSEPAGTGMAYTTVAAGDDMAQVIRRIVPGQSIAKNNAKASEEQQKEEHMSAFPFVSVPVTADTMDISLGYTYICPWQQPMQHAYGDLFTNTAETLLFSSYVIGRLDKGFHSLLSTCLLEWSFIQSLDAGKQVGKILLQKNLKSCLALWNTFAKMHARKGQWTDARKIWTRALAIGRTLEQKTEHQWLFVLRKSWAIMEALHGGGLEMCIRILGASFDEFEEIALMCESSSVSDAIGHSAATGGVFCCLRAQSVVEETVSEYHRMTVNADTGDVREAMDDEVRHALLAARLWIAYYAHNRDCGALNDCYKRSVGEYHHHQNHHQNHTQATVACSGKSDRELLTMELCSIYLYHAKTCKVYRAGDLRAHLVAGISLNVHNTVFWEMLSFLETRTRISNRVHSHLITMLGNCASTTDLYMLGIYYCGQGIRGNENSMRWLLQQKAVSTERGASTQSVALWTAYVLFELHCGHKRRAKRVALQALNHCPWAKPLYLLCMDKDVLADQFSLEEKTMLVRGMVNAGLRSHSCCGNEPPQ
ncbi:hypothetical protein IWW45_001300 [Coemansia sp. RSA 485]|nr:hypothetical protein IWW45_001300 [Coemansia sp. RSA 485]